MHKICKFSLKKFFYSVLILELIIFQDVQFLSDVHCAQTVNRMLPRNKKVKRKQNQNQNPTEYQPPVSMVTTKCYPRIIVKVVDF